jgi:putative iron-dependent peroxidase
VYSRDLWVVEKMLERMFVGDPPGLHDRLLDFSTPVTGSVFFAPSAAALEQLFADAVDRPSGEGAGTSSGDGSLGIGSNRASEPRKGTP